jgi:hypothetical protein
MYATRTTHFHLDFVRSYTCPVIILNLGLLSHYILPRFSLTRVGHRPTLFLLLEDATGQQVTEEHRVIDEAIRDRGEGYTVFSIVRVKECLFPLQS